jgi:uncharacterized protein (DUF1697 family)
MRASTTYVAFLRAINVAGHAKLKMDDLRAAFASAGGRNVVTTIQTGNVIFDVAEGRSDKVFQAMRRKLDDLIGARSTIIFREAAELGLLLKSAPFKGLEKDRTLKLYVAFLAESPRPKPKLPLVSEKEKLEVLQIKKPAAFIISRQKKNGMCGFPNNFIEKEFGVPATSRNVSTLNKVVALTLAR